MRGRRIRAAVAGVITAGLLLAGCAGGGAGNGSAGASGEAEQLAIGTMSNPTSLDPKDAGGGTIPFFQATYDTLIKRSADGSFTPMLATAWAYNDARTELSLTLRDGVTFTDGATFDGAAVKANVEHFKNGGGQSATQASQIASVEVTDATHVVIKLSAPDPSLEWSLSDALGLMATPNKLGSDDLKTAPVGTGPYTMNAAETAIGTTWVFDRRDDYWGDKLPFKRVVFSVFDNENAMVNGLKTGQLNSALLQTSDQQAAAKSDANLTSQDTSFDFQGILIFDRGGKLNPALADARVRQALNYAIDRDALVEGIRQGRGTATAQVFGTSTKGYDASLDTYYSYDPAKAKALLAEAGYASGLTVTLPNMPTISTDNIRTALTSQMAEAGITLEWAGSANPLQEIFRQFKFPGMVMNMGQSSNDWNYVQTYIQPGTFNFFGNSDPVLTEQAATLQTTTGAEYDAAATAINRRFVEQGWFVPFYRMTYALVSDKTVTVVPQDGMAVPSLYNYTPAS